MAAVGGVVNGNMGSASHLVGDRQKNIDNVADQVKALFSDFLHQYSSDESSNGRQSTTPTNTPTPSQSLSERDYVVQVQRMKETEKTTLWVNFEHLADDPYYVVRDSIEQHYYRVYPTLCAAVQSFVLEHAPNHPRAKDEYNPFHVAFYNLPANLTIRDLKTAQIGRLVSICGTVTRTSQVRPELSIATFRCLDCGVINRGVAQQFKYTEPTTCINPVCTNRINFELDPTLCSFVDFQSLRVQENSSEIPPGSMPRSLRVILRNDIVDSAKPGDKCIFAGTLLVVPDVRQMSKPSAARGGGGGRRSNTGREEGRRDRDNNEGGVSGLRELGIRDLSYSLVFLASSVKSMHANMSGWGAFAFGGEEVSADSNDMDALADKMKKLFTEEERRRVKEMSEKSRIYSRLVQSIAPSIAGHEDIKRGILLMLFGGVHKRTYDNASLRGDINVCIVGDPSTSKSQFLKYVCTFLPRAVYTSGKASSAAGLTASVVKDVETGEFGIEAGALMLADNGICCIDEFDKMDPNDQVAIHEAMEQQTISIAKAGVKATLNARTSILAAANPIGGRYDRSKTLKQNIDISAPIMSRFDLFFVVLDENDPSIDFNVARHIVNIHNQRPLHQPDFSMDDLQLYIRFARSIIKPQLTPEAREYLVNAFVTLRQDDSSGASRSSFRITTRQLESLIRLAEARARVDLSDDIKEEHAREAVRLLKKSIVHVESRDVDLEEEEEIEESGKDEMKDDNNDDNQDDDNNDDNNDDDGHGRRRNPDSENKEDDADRTRSPAAKSTPKTPAASGAKKHVPITMVEYRRITQLLVHMVQEYERKSNKVGMEQAELIREFVGQEKEADDTNDLQRQIKMVNLVIHRLLNVDRILIEVPSVDGKPRKITERQLTVHPNYTPDILPKILEAKRQYGDEDDHKRPLSKKDAEFALAKLRTDTAVASPSVIDTSNELKSPERPTKRMKGDETPSQPIDEPVDHQSADDVKALIRASKTATPARTSTDTPSTTTRRRGRGSASPAVRSPTATASAPSPSPASTRRAKRSSPSK